MQSFFMRIISRTKNIIFILSSSILFFILLQILPIWKILKSISLIPNINFWRAIDLYYEYIFKSFIHLSFLQAFFIITLSLLLSFNILLFFLYIKRQRKIFAGKSFLASVSGAFLGLLGVGCSSCGALLITPILVFLGLESHLQYFVEHTIFVSFLGILFVFLSILYLLYQLSKPLVCKPKNTLN